MTLSVTSVIDPITRVVRPAASRAAMQRVCTRRYEPVRVPHPVLPRRTLGVPPEDAVEGLLQAIEIVGMHQREPAVA
jgi:hypothetical protein